MKKVSPIITAPVHSHYFAVWHGGGVRIIPGRRLDYVLLTEHNVVRARMYQVLLLIIHILLLVLLLLLLLLLLLILLFHYFVGRSHPQQEQAAPTTEQQQLLSSSPQRTRRRQRCRSCALPALRCIWLHDFAGHRGVPRWHAPAKSAVRLVG